MRWVNISARDTEGVEVDEEVEEVEEEVEESVRALYTSCAVSVISCIVVDISFSLAEFVRSSWLSKLSIQCDVCVSDLDAE